MLSSEMLDIVVFGEWVRRNLVTRKEKVNEREDSNKSACVLTLRRPSGK